jgi:hypothetical protein
MATQISPSKILICSDHRVRDGDTNDSFSVNLEQQLEKPTSILLRTVSFPMLAYNIPSYESTFYWYFTDAPNALRSLKMNINRAFLTPIQLMNQFNSDAIAAGISLRLSFDPDPTSASFAENGANSQTYKYTLSASTAFRLPGWSDNVWDGSATRSMYYNLNQRLGFTNQYSTSFASSLVGDAPPNIQRTSTIHIRTSLGADTLSTTVGIPGINGASSFRDIIASIPCSAKFGEILTFQENSNTGRIIKGLTHNIRGIDIRILDDQFQPLGLPNNAICNFEFDFSYT